MNGAVGQYCGTSDTDIVTVHLGRQKDINGTRRQMAQLVKFTMQTGGFPAPEETVGVCLERRESEEM